VVERLCGRCEALSSSPSNKKQQQQNTLLHLVKLAIIPWCPPLFEMVIAGDQSLGNLSTIEFWAGVQDATCTPPVGGPGFHSQHCKTKKTK
jgi:hypothetical protein